jgi:hypothetical protein
MRPYQMAVIVNEDLPGVILMKAMNGVIDHARKPQLRHKSSTIEHPEQTGDTFETH